MGNTLSPTVFYEACQRGDIRLVEKVLSGISPQLKQSLFAHRVEEMPMTSTPLFTAIQNHHVEIVELLLKHGMDPNARLKVSYLLGHYYVFVHFIYTCVWLDSVIRWLRNSVNARHSLARCGDCRRVASIPRRLRRN